MWANSGRWWRTEEPDVPQSIGSQSISRDWRLNTTSCVLNTYVVGGDVVDSSNPCYLLWVQLEAPTSSCTAASPGSVLQRGTDAQWLPCWCTWQRICQQCGTWVHPWTQPQGTSLLISFTWLIALMRTFKTMLSHGGESRHLFLSLRRERWSMMLTVGFSQMSCREFPSTRVCWDFYCEWMLDFCHIYWDAHVLCLPY